MAAEVGERSLRCEKREMSNGSARGSGHFGPVAPLEDGIRRFRRRVGILLFAAFAPACSCGSDGATGGSPSETVLECGSCCLETKIASARSCEILLSGAPVGSPRFAEEVRGTTMVKGGRYAIAFTSRADRAFAGPAVAFGHGADAECSVEILNATCYDRQGREISDSGMKLTVKGSRQ